MVEGDAPEALSTRLNDRPFLRDYIGKSNSAIDPSSDVFATGYNQETDGPDSWHETWAV